MPKVLPPQDAAAQRTPAHHFHNPCHFLYDGIPIIRLRLSKEHKRDSSVRVDN
jgi:hypothetical protein